MKRLIPIFTLMFIAISASAQSDTLYISLPKGKIAKFAVDQIYSMGFTPITSQGDFPSEDDSTDLLWVNPAERPKLLLEAAGRDCGKELGAHIEIEDYQYDEIAEFTKDLVKGCSTEYQKYNKVYSWIRNNIKYEYTDNKPYTVFTQKKGICQGYADLLTVMLHSLEIPCITVNGFIPEGGHAWNYLNADDHWYMSDPTNGFKFDIDDVASYQNRFNVTAIQASLFEDEYCTYNYYNQALNVESFKSGNSVVYVPYSVNGFKITSVNPTKEDSKDIKELYLGKNIATLDIDGNTFGINIRYKGIEIIEVDPKNSYMSSYYNVIYKGDEMYMVAPAVKFLQIKPIKLDKESKLKNLEKLECIVFESGTERLDAYVVEYCPNLKKAYIPEDTEVDQNAFSNVHPDFEIIRGEYDGEYD